MGTADPTASATDPAALRELQLILQHYELQPPLWKSLAKSAREAAEANEALAAANRKRGCMPKEVRTVGSMEAVMGFASLKSDGEMRV